MYCHKCGTTLDKVKISEVCKKGDNGYTNKILGHATIGMDKIEKAHYIYRCGGCDLEITYEKQCIIAKKQKKEKIHQRTKDICSRGVFGRKRKSIGDM